LHLLAQLNQAAPGGLLLPVIVLQDTALAKRPAGPG
jgi:hypothetical protein